jgi:hypothetical protein
MSEVRPQGRLVARVRPFVVGVLVVLGTSVAPGQASPSSISPDSLPIGARVRGFTATGGVSIDGFVRGTSTDTIRVGECKACDPGTTIPLSTLRYLQVERRRHRIEGGRVAVYMGIGLFAGALAGAAAGGIYAVHETHDPKCGDLCGLSVLAVPYWGAIGGAAGVVTGGIVGLSHHESYWVGVRLPVPPP